MKVIAILVMLILLTGCLQWVTPTPCPTCVPVVTVAPTASPTTAPTVEPIVLQWDSRLDGLNVKYEPVANARYRLVAAWMTINGSWDETPRWAWEWVDKVTGGGGDHNMFAGVYQLNGEPLQGKNVIFGWPGTQTNFVTDAAGWGNGDCQAVYYPDKGQTGPYYLEPLKGDKLVGGGLPYGQHVSIMGVWEEVKLSPIMAILSWIVGD
jgi:hypothetical protein